MRHDVGTSSTDDIRTRSHESADELRRPPAASHTRDVRITQYRSLYVFQDWDYRRLSERRGSDRVRGDIGLSLLDQYPDIEWGFLPDYGDEMRPEAANDWDALLVLAPKITAATVAGAQRLKIVARFGVGYDNVDVAACTSAGVAVTITPDSVRRPVAVATVALILAMMHNIVIKDAITRRGLWQEKLQYMGTGVTGKTLGIIGLGNIGQEVVRVSRSLGFEYLAHDPYPSSRPDPDARGSLRGTGGAPADVGHRLHHGTAHQ